MSDAAGSRRSSSYLDMPLREFEDRLLNAENPLTAALDSLYGEGNWTELQADSLGDAIRAAIDQACEDAASDATEPWDA